MKIASRIHNRDGSPRTITINDRPYVFARTEDHQGNLHFVAEVKNPDHAEILLGKPHFYVFGEDLQPQATLRRVADTSTASTSTTGTAADSTASTGSQSGVLTETKFSDDVVAEANHLLTVKPSGMAGAIGRVSSIHVVLAALAIEQAGKKRQSVITLFEQTINGSVVGDKA